jgi:hypothetical protein
MAEMGNGYGSEFHLLRYFGRHRCLLDELVSNATRAEVKRWLDQEFDRNKTCKDRELVGLDFLDAANEARRKWYEFWPQRGNPPNWDAVGWVQRNGENELLLVEAKANLEELQSSCRAKEEGGRGLIQDSFEKVKLSLGVAKHHNWLNGYYQYCNRIAVLDFLNQKGTPTRLLFIYFLGDKRPDGRTCPVDEVEWRRALERQRAHVGLAPDHPRSDRVHELFVEVCPQN